MENSTRSGFQVSSEYQPTGDQPQAIEKLASGLDAGQRAQTLLGVTGSGKTYTMARVIEQAGRPTLVIAHNKTLAAQLASEFAEFFPNNAVEYFVCYYDYYQPEAYVPRTDTFIEKDAQINEDIDRLGTRRPARCSRGGTSSSSPASLRSTASGARRSTARRWCCCEKGGFYDLDDVLRDLVDIQYMRNDFQLDRGNFRVRGDVLEVHPAYQDYDLPHLLLWGRGRGHDRGRPADRRDPARARHADRLPGDPLRHRRGQARRRHQEHRGGAGAAGRGAERARARSWRRTVSSSAPDTTWR